MRGTQNQTKHVFITGGVVSSLGKGITSASLALLLKRRGYRVSIQKLDPYLNVDPGTMSPYQHGEVFVTGDGEETDLDLGHYERFADLTCSKSSNVTTGRIYSNVIARERRGDYDGKTVQVIPHVTDEIKQAICNIHGPDVDIAITEVGGTAGDIESHPFLEAIRQFRQEVGREGAVFLHLTLVPYISAAGEVKTKPSQQSVGILREIGIIPDILLCRCEKHLTEEHFNKLALFCNVERDLVFEEQDVQNSIYEVPLELAKQDVDKYVLELLGSHVFDLDISDWRDMVQRLTQPTEQKVTIAVVGKYVRLQDAYKSLYEALGHGSEANDVELDLRRIEAEELENGEKFDDLAAADGILVPGGFGDRGVEGKLVAARYARENRIPYLGICLGMQCAVIEFARNVCGLTDANSTEFNPDTSAPVISLMEQQREVVNRGGTMRKGGYRCTLTESSWARTAYGRDEVTERHRHRYEFNNEMTDTLVEKGMRVAGVCPENNLVEIVELEEHPWFVTCQFHPEFQSRPMTPHPLFREFIAAAERYHKEKDSSGRQEEGG